jgi:hypothetical protein
VKTILDLGTGGVWQPVHEELVDADDALSGIGGDAVVLKKLIVLFFFLENVFAHG